jgi:hypothetical protein
VVGERESGEDAARGASSAGFDQRCGRGDSSRPTKSQTREAALFFEPLFSLTFHAPTRDFAGRGGSRPHAPSHEHSGAVAVVEDGNLNHYFLEVFNGIIAAAVRHGPNTTLA